METQLITAVRAIDSDWDLNTEQDLYSDEIEVVVDYTDNDLPTAPYIKCFGSSNAANAFIEKAFMNAAI